MTRPVPRGSHHATVDEWGRDPVAVAWAARLARLRWDVRVSGRDNVPEGGALLVVNTRPRALTTMMVAWSLATHTGRPVRFVGRSDQLPLGPWQQRLGGLLTRPDEVAGALRGGDLVVIGVAVPPSRGPVAALDPAMVDVAMREHVSVHPVAVRSGATRRVVDLRIEPARDVPLGRREPPAEIERVEIELAEIELAEVAEHRLRNGSSGTAAAPSPRLSS